MNNLHEYLKTVAPDGIKKDGAQYYTCPQCKGRKKLEVDHHLALWYCHKCGVGGKLQEFGETRTYQRTPIPTDVMEEVLSNLRGYRRISSRSLYWEWLSQHREIPPAKIAELMPHSGPSILRCYFPAFRLGGTIPVYFVGRSMFDTVSPKYLYPSMGSFPCNKGEVLWGLHRIRGPVKTLTVCEGIFDALWVDHGVALLGKTISPSQTQTIVQIGPKEITVVLDGDARKEAAVVASHIAKSITVPIYNVALPCGTDPDDFRKEIRARARVTRERVV